MRTVLLNSVDVSKYIVSIPDVEELAGEFGQLTITEFPTITGDNTPRFWDVLNPASPFFGELDITKNIIEIWNNGINVFRGSITRITSNEQSKTADISLKSNIQKIIENSIVYSSSDNSNPALIVKEICQLYKIPFETKSFARSSQVYSDNAVVCNAFYKNDTTILNAIQQVAEIGCARVYIYDQKIHFDTFRNRSVAGIFTVTDDPDNDNGITLFSPPETVNVEKEPKKGYSIEYVNGSGALSAVFGSETERDFSLSAGNSSPMRINNLQSAVFIGDLWLTYFQTPQKIITFTIDANVGKTLDINDPLTFVYKGRSAITVDIVGINKSNNVVTTIKGLTR